jgi:hypothetical protein
MKTSDAGLVFPVFGITPDRGIWGFADLDTFTSCGAMTLRENLQLGMEVIDSNLDRWIVRSVRPLGRAEPFWRWLVSRLLSTPQIRIEHELERLPSVSLDQAKARLILGLETFPDHYANDDEADTVLPPLIAEVRAMDHLSDALDLLGLDSFMAY